MLNFAGRGNFTAPPVITTIPSTERKVARFRIACNDSYRAADGNWVKNDPVFISCEAWGRLAEDVETHTDTGTAVVVVGRWKAATYTKDGESHHRQWVEVTSMGPAWGRRPVEAAATSDHAPEQKPASAEDDDVWAGAK